MADRIGAQMIVEPSFDEYVRARSDGLLRFYHDYSFGQIAEALGCPESIARWPEPPNSSCARRCSTSPWAAPASWESPAPTGSAEIPILGRVAYQNLDAPGGGDGRDRVRG